MSGLVETSWYKSLVVLESTKSQAQRIKEPMTSFVRGKIKKFGRTDSQLSTRDRDRDRERDSGPEDDGSPSEEYVEVRVRSGSSSSPSIRRSQRRQLDGQAGSAAAASTADGLWDDGEKAIYEQQLDQLQEQLMAVMIEKDELAEKLKKLSETRANSPGSRANSLLSDQLTMEVHKGGLHLGDDPEGDDWVSVHRREESGLRHRSSAQTNPDGQELKVSEDVDDSSHAPSKPQLLKRFYTATTRCFWRFLSEFTVEGDEIIGRVDTSNDPVTYKKLKGNWRRFCEGIQPLRWFVTTVNGVINWSQPSLSLACFIIYMYAVWRGVLIPLVLLMCLGWLAYSYLKTSGILAQFSLVQTDNSNSEQADMAPRTSAREYWNLITSVAQTVQNKSGEVADSLEKVYNLLSWHHPQGAKRIFTILLVAFIISCILPEATVIRLFGLFLGYKLFIERNIYRRFPKVKRKYDSMGKLWDELPTNAELEALVEAQDALRAEQEHQSTTGTADSTVDHSMTAVCSSDHSFCERFGLELEDRPLDAWKSGRRCVFIDRDRPLSNVMTPGKLFLTKHFVCFERLSKSKDSDDRVLISLSEIKSIKKAKPFARLPGSGMALELHIEHQEKPVVFGAILNRDEVYLQFVAAGRRAQLAWASRADQN